MSASYRRNLHVVLYGDINANLVDGATIWLQSTATILAQLGLERVEIILKAPIERDTIVGPLLASEGLDVVEPSRILTARGGAEAVAARVPDIVIVRGSRVAREMARIASLHGRLWTYLTDIPQHPLLVSEARQEQIREIVLASEVLLCQTDALRGHMETLVPEACGRTALWPPALPLEQMPTRKRRFGAEPLRLAYAGKFAPRWRTLEMTSLPTRLETAGIPAQIEFIGDKIHAGPDGESYRERMRKALEDTEGVTWVGALSREATFNRLAEADFGLAWRDPSLDASLELSTKLLEYGAMRVPALLNRTDEHVTMLGADYPLFVADEDDVVEVVQACLRRPQTYKIAVERLAAVAEQHSFVVAKGRFAKLLARRRPRATVGQPGQRTRVLVATHDMKFFQSIADFLSALPSIDLRFDHWEHLLRHDEEASRAALVDADVVFCEWAGPNSVWYSHHVRPHQRLVVRLHRFELYRSWPHQVRVNNIHTMVCVNDHYRTEIVQELGWPAARAVTIPNYVDHLDLDRPKLDDARFRIGMIGIAPMRKRFDLGVELLARLRRIDPRFSLVAKSKFMHEYSHFWGQPDERRYDRAVWRRVETDPDVLGAVHVDRFGPDVAHWLRRVGWVISTSEDESFHLATAEGMASGAVPVVRDWKGADGIYGDRWIHSSLDEMVSHIAGAALDGSWEQLARDAKRESRRWDVTAVARQFENVLLS